MNESINLVPLFVTENPVHDETRYSTQVSAVPPVDHDQFSNVKQHHMRRITIILLVFILTIILTTVLITNTILPTPKGSTKTSDSQFSEKRAKVYLNELLDIGIRRNTSQRVRTANYIYNTLQQIKNESKIYNYNDNYSYDGNANTRIAIEIGIINDTMRNDYLITNVYCLIGLIEKSNNYTNNDKNRKSNNDYTNYKLKTSSTVLFSAHFDSQPLTKGLNDDGIGIAIGLESVYNILNIKNENYVTNSLLKHNNILFVFVDGEELGT